MKRDNKTVGITLRFIVSDLEVVEHGKKRVACYDTGFAIIEKNRTKGIEHVIEPFNHRDDILPLIDELLRRNRVMMVSACSRPRVLSHRRGKRGNVCQP